jgi:hypothetical protein
MNAPTQNMQITVNYQTKKTINRCANILGTTANYLISDILDQSVEELEAFTKAFLDKKKWHEDTGATHETISEEFFSRFQDDSEIEIFSSDPNDGLPNEPTGNFQPISNFK